MLACRLWLEGFRVSHAWGTALGAGGGWSESCARVAAIEAAMAALAADVAEGGWCVPHHCCDGGEEECVDGESQGDDAEGDCAGPIVCARGVDLLLWRELDAALDDDLFRRRTVQRNVIFVLYRSQRPSDRNIFVIPPVMQRVPLFLAHERAREAVYS